MLRNMEMCQPNRLLFHQKSLDMGPILVKKSLKRGPISQKLQKKKMVKLASFEAKNPYRWVLTWDNFEKLSIQPVFE